MAGLFVLIDQCYMNEYYGIWNIFSCLLIELHILHLFYVFMGLKLKSRQHSGAPTCGKDMSFSIVSSCTTHLLCSCNLYHTLVHLVFFAQF